MPTLLYIWEYGAGLGHITTFLPIAEKMRESGWKVMFSIPPLSPSTQDAERLIDHHGFERHHNPGSPSLVGNADVNNHAMLVGSMCGFQDSCALTFTLKSWLSVLDEIQPALVVSEYSVAGRYAAKLLHIPSVILDRGYFTPEPGHSLPRFSDHVAPGYPRPPMSEQKEQAESRRLLKVVNRSLQDIGAPEITELEELFQADDTLWLTYPILSPLRHRERSKFIGLAPYTGGSEEPEWPSHDNRKPKLFVYLDGHNPRARLILRALMNDPNNNVLVHMPGLKPIAAKRFARDHLTISIKPYNTAKALEQADLVICHAGCNLVAETLLAGKPMLLAPIQQLQMFNAMRAEQQGAGRILPEQLNDEVIQGLIKTTLSSQYQTVQAKAFAHTHAPANLKDAAERLCAVVKEVEASQRFFAKLELQRPPKKVRFRDYDVVFLSYDEPNADENWEKLKAIAPNAKRVHGVAGFDAAHKAAGRAAETERFILIDADNELDPAFLDIEATIPAHLEHSVWQWCSVNEPSGLVYAFGGVKIWTKSVIEGMRTHESCEDDGNPLAIDFWNQPSYQVFNSVYSRNYTNGSPNQAFRAGFRETVKLGRLNGWLKSPKDVERMANNPEIRRMAIWMCAGADAENGLWSILGARMAFLSYFDSDLAFKSVNDYQEMSDQWEQIFASLVEPQVCERTKFGKLRCEIYTPELEAEVVRLGDRIRQLISQPPVIDMNPDQSAAFKHAMLKNVKDVPLFTPVLASREL